MAKGKKNSSNDFKARESMTAMLSSLFVGKMLSVEFFKKNFIYIAFAVGMMLMYISTKYTCQKYQAEIIGLKHELDKANTDWVNSSAKYNSMIRESQMKAYVDTMRLDLEVPEQPPYNLDMK